MQNKDSNKTRSTLTLKLKLPAGSASSDAKPVAIKSDVGIRKSGGSSVQVTIKGRKKDTKDSGSSNLSQSEVEARFKAISGLKHSKSNLSDDEVLSKISRKNLDQATSDSDSQDQEKSVSQDNQSREGSGFQVDSFDVRNKIKASIAVADKKKEERDKIVAERKKQQEQAAKEKFEKDKKNKPRKAFDDFEQENEAKKSKFGNRKEEKINVRKLTYIIEDDDSDGFVRRRKKQQVKQQSV